MKNTSSWKKIIDFCWIQMIGLAVGIGALAWAFSVSTGLVLLWLPLLILGCALISLGIWWKRYKNVFESFLVYVTSVCVLFSFLLLVPIVVERSLSCFVYFYAVEQGGISVSQIPPEFSNQFIQKRFDDGVVGHFLEKQGERYLPTSRSRLFYTIYHPLGKLTNTLSNYQRFKQTVQQETPGEDHDL